MSEDEEDTIEENMEEFEKLDKEGQKDVIDNVLEKYDKRLEETDDEEEKQKIRLKKSILKKMADKLE